MNPNPLTRPVGSSHVRAPVLVLLAAALLAGCAQPGDTPTPAPRVGVDPPQDGAPPIECPPAASQSMAAPTQVRVATDAQGRGPGLHRLERDAWLFVYASYKDTLREDRVTRVNEVHVARAADGALVVCTRVELATPIEVDNERRSYDVAVLIEALQPLPGGERRVGVNWVAGCPCDPLPQGSVVATFVEA